MSEPLLIATDLDGSLLDEETYGFDAARPALDALAEGGALLVLASSKTRAEVTRLARALGVRSPLIVENGGALLLPGGVLSRRVGASRPAGRYRVIPLGLPRRTLVAALAKISAETAAPVRGFSSMSAGEIETITGLSRAAARLARKREWDEPFLADPEAAERVAEAARRRGLVVARGGRFLHLTGATDKGVALVLLLDLLGAEGRPYRTVALGDAANDLPLLERVDRPIVIPRPGGAVDATLAARLPLAERAPAAGPAGWNAAVLAVLAGKRLPVLATAQAGSLRC